MFPEPNTSDRVEHPRPDIEHWWAAKAMIASYNHVYKAAYKTRYESRGPIGVSIYGDAPIASFQYEFLALSENNDSVLDAVFDYPIPDGKKYVIDVFHAQPSNPALKLHYTRFGYEFVRTGLLLGADLPNPSAVPDNIQKAETIQQAETANQSLAREGERIHLETLRDAHIHSFYATVDGEAAGWVQLVTVSSGSGYIHQLYVLKAYRRRRLGTALVQCAQRQALALGLKRMVLIPSEMGLPLYRRLGYHPLLYFSVFRLAQDHAQE